jgi:hypothetical protein
MAAAMLVAPPLYAQSLTPGPPGPYVVDVRVITAGIPKDPSFYPPVPSGTLAPTRGLGFEVDAHFYAGHWKGSHLGFGVGLLRARGSATSPQPTSSTSGSTTTTAVVPRPDIDSTITALVPQLSLNFGARDGWSYLSIGYGGTEVRTVTSNVPMAESRKTGRIPVINYGGGAKWFFTSRLALGFDLRFHRLSATSTHGTPASTLFGASVGLSVR